MNTMIWPHYRDEINYENTPKHEHKTSISFKKEFTNELI